MTVDRNANTMARVRRALQRLNPVVLDTDPALEFHVGALRVKVKADSGITRDANGLSVKLKTDGGLAADSNGLHCVSATEAVAGIVKQCDHIAPMGLTISDPPTQAEVQQIADTLDFFMTSVVNALIMAAS